MLLHRLTAMTYRADLPATDAATFLNERPNAVLLDVRTQAEWTFVGVPDLAGCRFVEWTSWPTGQPNPNFVASATEGLVADQPIVVICRSGGRSAAAANVLSAAGFTEVYNVADGFEGDLDAQGHRSGGWRGSGLPWRQS